jgi:hypothetical protein
MDQRIMPAASPQPTSSTASARNCRERAFGFTTGIPLETDVKSTTAVFDQIMTGVGIRAVMPIKKIDGSF